jgi:lipopolysaccharide transport system permease protein
MLCWNLFAQIIQRASDSLVTNANLVSKIYFPRAVLPISTVYGVLLDFVVASTILVFLLIAYRIPVTGMIVLAPLAAAMAVLQSLGLGVWLSALNVSYRDVRYVVPVIVQFLFWATPVAYSMSNVPRSARAIVAMNPMAGTVELFRCATLGTPLSNWQPVIISAVSSALFLLLGTFLFQRAERRFADVI